MTSSTATETPETTENGLGDKELSAFPSASEKAAVPQADVPQLDSLPVEGRTNAPPLTMQYMQHFENVLSQSRRVGAVSGGASVPSAPTSTTTSAPTTPLSENLSELSFQEPVQPKMSCSAMPQQTGHPQP